MKKGSSVSFGNVRGRFGCVLGGSVMLLGLLATSACEDDTSPTTPSDVDSGSFDVDASDSGGLASKDGSNGEDTGTGDDAGGDGGPNALEPVACEKRVRIDGLRGVDGSSTMSATHSGDRWVVLWYQIGAVSPDAKYHVKGRVFDGAALLAEQDLGIEQGYAPPIPIVADGAGHGFTQWFEESGGQRAVLDFAAGSFSKSAFAAVSNGKSTPVTMAPLAAGGAVSAYRTDTAVAADRWDPADSTWKSTNLTGPAQLDDLQLATNAAGKAAATWNVSDGAGGTNLTIATWDGATWKTATKSFPLADGLLASGFRHVVLDDGDVFFAWLVGGRVIETSTYHPSAAAGSEWDAPLPIEESTESLGSSAPLVVRDGNGRIAIGWLRGTNAFVRRRATNTWADKEDLGAADSLRLAVDPFSNLVALTTRLADGIGIARSPAGGASWSARVPVGVGISNGTNLLRMADVVFDTAGRPTVLSMQDLPDDPGVGLGLVYAKCK